MSRELTALLDAADDARRELHDEYLSTEHLLLALADRLDVDREDLLAALAQVRGSHRVTSQNPEEQYQALEKYGRDLTEAARAGADRPGHRTRRRDPPRHPGAVAPHQEQPGADRRAGRGQDRHRRGPGPAHRRGRRAREPEGQAPHRARPVEHGGRRQVPRRVRGAAQGRAQGDHRQRRRGGHLHRRDAHRRRRRRRQRGRHGRRQHAQADAGARSAAHDRGHHPRRVPQVHREGRRARAPLPAGVRGPAHRSRTPSPSCAASRSATRSTTACASRTRRWWPPPCCPTATSPGASCPTRPST